MSSSPNAPARAEMAPPPPPPPFSELMDLVCPVDVVLGQGTMSVRDCLGLSVTSVVRLTWSAGEHLHIVASGVPIAKGDVVIVDNRAAVRVTDILPAPGLER